MLGERARRPGSTWQRPQIPRPPQTESMSTPSERAASRTVVPSGKRPRRPDGVKMTSGVGGLAHGRPLSRRPRFRPAPARAGDVDPAPLLALQRGRPERPDPAAALGVVAHQHVGGHHRMADTFGDRVRDRRREPAGDRHREVAAVDPLAVGQAEADVRRAAGAVDLELVAQPPEDAEDLAAGVAHRPDRHQQRVDHDVLARDAVVGGPLDDLLGDREADVGVLGDAGLVVGDRDDRGAVLLDQRQDPLEPLVLAGHRVDAAPCPGRRPGRPRAPRRSTSRSTAGGRSATGRAGSSWPGSPARRPAGSRR